MRWGCCEAEAEHCCALLALCAFRPQFQMMLMMISSLSPFLCMKIKFYTDWRLLPSEASCSMYVCTTVYVWYSWMKKSNIGCANAHSTPKPQIPILSYILLSVKVVSPWSTPREFYKTHKDWQKCIAPSGSRTRLPRLGNSDANRYTNGTCLLCKNYQIIKQ